MKREELKKVYDGKKQKREKRKDGSYKIIQGFVNSTFGEFLTWHQQSNFDQGCWYCGLTNEESFQLYNMRPHATRGGKRGRRLEIDRKDPLQPYDNLPNLVWCCYWCNNAKSNFFSEEEFTFVAIEIIRQLRNIIRVNNPKML